MRPLSIESTLLLSFWYRTSLLILLKFNYFYINKSFFLKIKRTAMGKKFAMVGSNLDVAYKEIKLFEFLPQVYPHDFVDFLLCNYFIEF